MVRRRRRGQRVVAILAITGVIGTATNCSGSSRDEASASTVVAFDAPVVAAARRLVVPGGRVIDLSRGGSTARVDSAHPITGVAPVAALDSDGEVVALGFADRDGGLRVGAASTALMLVMGLPGMWVNDPGVLRVLSLSLSRSPAFRRLIDAIQGHLQNRVATLSDDLAPLVTAVGDELAVRPVEPQRGRSAAPLLRQRADDSQECSQSDFWRDLDRDVAATNPAGVLEAPLRRFCLSKPKISGRSVDVAYVQTGARYTFVLDSALTNVLAYVPSREIGTDSVAGFVGAYLKSEMDQWAKIGTAGMKCALSILPGVDCKKPLDVLVDYLLKDGKALIEAAVGPPVKGTFPLVLDDAGNASFAIAGWGIPTRDGATEPTAIVNIGSLVLSVIDMFGPIFKFLLDNATSFGGGTLASAKKCFSPTAFLRHVLGSREAVVALIKYIADNRAAVQLALDDDLSGALKKLDLRGLFKTVWWKGVDTVRECAMLPLNAGISLLDDASGLLEDLSVSGYAIAGKILKGLKILKIFDAALNVGFLLGKWDVVEQKIGAPDCVAGAVMRSPAAAFAQLAPAFSKICPGSTPPHPAKVTPPVTEDALRSLDATSLCQRDFDAFATDNGVTFEGAIRTSPFAGVSGAPLAVGKLDGDAVVDGVAVLECDFPYATSYVPYDVVVVRAAAPTQPIALDVAAGLNEAYRVRSVAIKSRSIRVGTSIAFGSDANCCRNADVTETFTWSGKAFVRSLRERVDPETKTKLLVQALNLQSRPTVASMTGEAAADRWMQLRAANGAIPDQQFEFEMQGQTARTPMRFATGVTIDLTWSHTSFDGFTLTSTVDDSGD